MKNRANDDRVKAIKKIMSGIIPKRYNDEDLAANVTDLLTDLRHFCEAKKLRFQHLDALAYSHYCEEDGDIKEVVSIIPLNTLKSAAKYKCDNCGYRAGEKKFPPAKDILLRVDVGGIFTDKECPKCGALAYPVVKREKQKMQIVVEMFGGTIEAIYHDNPDFELDIIFTENRKYTDNEPENETWVWKDNFVYTRTDSGAAPKFVNLVFKKGEAYGKEDGGDK